MSYKPELSLTSIFSITKDVSRRGGIIGFTHGTFDLFHVSHLDLLQKASKRCDILLVGVEQDVAVEAYKRKPIIPEQSRANIIRNVEGVYSSFIMPIPNFDDDQRRDFYKDLKIGKFFVGRNFFVLDRVRSRVENAGAKFYKLNTILKPNTTGIIKTVVDRNNDIRIE